MSSPPRNLEEEEESLFEKTDESLLCNLSILLDYIMLDLSKDKDYMAVLTKQWRLIVYKLKCTDSDIKYIGDPIEYNVGKVDSIRNFYMYLSVASKTGDVVISFAEFEGGNYPFFTTKTPQPSCRNCRVYSTRYGEEPREIPFQGRAVYVKDKLVLVGAHTLDVHYADTLKLKYFLDLKGLKEGFEEYIGWEDFTQHTTWAKYVANELDETINGNKLITKTNDAEKTNDGDKLILMTRHIQANILVTNYRGNLTRVWSILDGSLLVSFITENTEYVMAISEDQRFVATYEETEKKVKVYCTKSNLLLYTYVPQNKQTNRRNFSVTCVRFYSYRPYLIIAGIKKDSESEIESQDTSNAFYEIWSISQERLILSDEEPGVYNKSIQPFVLECLSEHDEEEQNNTQSSGTEESSESNSNGSGSNSSQPVPENNSEVSGSDDSQTILENGSNRSKSNSPPPNLESSSNVHKSSSPQSTPESNSDASGSNYAKPVPKSSSDGSGSNRTSPNLTSKDNTNSRKNHLPVCVVFAKHNPPGKLEFRKTLVFKYNKPSLNIEFVPENQVDWEGFSFQKLGGSVPLQKPLSDICEPLDGKHTLGYISTHLPVVYLLRFGTHMVQLWQLAIIPKEEVEAARKAGNIFDFQDISRPSETEYYNTIEHSQLKFARAYKGYHHDHLSSFRDTWESFGSNIHFMKDKGHILVDIKKHSKQTKTTTGENQPINTSIQRNKSCITRCTPKKPEAKITEDELFLPLSRIESSETEYEFCEIESVFQALHYLASVSYVTKDKCSDEDYSKDLFKANKNDLYKGLTNIINTVLKSQSCCRYFLTISGSKTLAMLAYTEKGQNLLFKIICNKNIPINVFSYMEPGKLKENVLTVLMEEANYNLFTLIFNEILIGYYKNGSGNLSAIMDALLFLQEENFTFQLLTSTDKLSFLPVKHGSVQILDSELVGMLSIKGLQQEETYRIEYLDTFSSMEQIERYNYYKWYMPLSYISYHLTLLKRSGFVIWVFGLLKTIYYIIFGNSRVKSKLARLCIVPLPYFNSYRSLPEEAIQVEGETEKDKKSMETKRFNGVEYYKYSPFSLLASSIKNNNIFKQGDTVMEMNVGYKWETFAKSRFYWILFCHAVYYVAYSTGVSFPEELFGYIPGTPLTHTSHIIAIVFMFISGFILLIQEFIQFYLNKLEYFKSFYNYVDLAAFILPVTTFALLRLRSPESTVLYPVSSVTTLILWAHLILRLRVFRPFGNLLEIIIQLAGKIFPVIIIMILVVMGFTNAIIVLLRRQENGFFQDQFGPPGSDAANLSNQSQQNNFKDIFLSYTTVWLFIFGYFDPVFDGDVGNYVMSLIFVVLFSFTVVIILFNVVIALMSGKIDKIIERGNKIWISHFAAVVSEIELLWVSDSTKFSKKNNPTHIYYNANVETIRLRHALIIEENENLKIKIKRELESSENI